MDTTKCDCESSGISPCSSCEQYGAPHTRVQNNWKKELQEHLRENWEIEFDKKFGYECDGKHPAQWTCRAQLCQGEVLYKQLKDFIRNII